MASRYTVGTSGSFGNADFRTQRTQHLDQHRAGLENSILPATASMAFLFVFIGFGWAIIKIWRFLTNAATWNSIARWIGVGVGMPRRAVVAMGQYVVRLSV